MHHSSALVVKRRLRCLVRFVLERSVWHGIRQYPAAYNLTVVGSGCPAMDEIIHAGISVRQLHRLQCFRTRYAQLIVVCNHSCGPVYSSPTLKALRPRFIIGLFTSQIVVLHREVFSAERLRIQGQTVHVP